MGLHAGGVGPDDQPQQDQAALAPGVVLKPKGDVDAIGLVEQQAFGLAAQPGGGQSRGRNPRPRLAFGRRDKPGDQHLDALQRAEFDVGGQRGDIALKLLEFAAAVRALGQVLVQGKGLVGGQEAEVVLAQFERRRALGPVQERCQSIVHPGQLLCSPATMGTRRQMRLHLAAGFPIQVGQQLPVIELRRCYTGHESFPLPTL